MKTLILLSALALSGCYHMRNARFVDQSESTAKAWICVPDEDPTNPAGIMCGDMGAVLSIKGTLPPVSE